MIADPDPNDCDLEVDIDPEERGETFNLDPETYKQLASACLSIRRTLMSIAKRRNACGCSVALYGAEQMLTLCVDRVSVSLFSQGLDSVDEPIPIVAVGNTPQDWKRIRCAMQHYLGGRQ